MRSGPSPATTSSIPAWRHAATATSRPLPRTSRAAISAYVPLVGARRRRERRASRAAATWACCTGAPSVRRRSSANALGTTTASACSTMRLRVQRQRRGVDRRLGAAAAAVAAQPRQRVGAVAARAVLAARIGARPDRADEPVVVQVQDDPCAPAARALASARQPHVGCRLCAWTIDAPVSRTAAPTSPGRSPPRSRPARRLAAPEADAVARQQLRLLAELLAHEPHQLLHRALLAAQRPVAVVQEQDHRS